jgi:hypothetical protein
MSGALNLSPFVQFVGRIMRVIKQDAPGHPLNRGIVVYHAGANIARRWADFQEFSEADQEYFQTLLPLVEWQPDDKRPYKAFTPGEGLPDQVEVRAQSDVELEELPLVQEDEARAIQLLKDRGRIPGDFDPVRQVLEPVPIAKQALRRAKRRRLAARVSHDAARLLATRGVNPGGYMLDKQRLGKDNFAIMVAALNRAVNSVVGRATGERSEFSRKELEDIEDRWNEILKAAETEVFNAE